MMGGQKGKELRMENAYPCKCFGVSLTCTCTIDFGLPATVHLAVVMDVHSEIASLMPEGCHRDVRHVSD